MNGHGPWAPVELPPRLWVPTFPTDDGGRAANGFDGFTSEIECQAECDARNRDVLASADAEIERLETALSKARELRALTLAALPQEG